MKTKSDAADILAVMQIGGEVIAERFVDLPLDNIRIFYLLLREDGCSRAVYDTACADMYSLLLYCANAPTIGNVCYLADVARMKEVGMAVLNRMADAAVTPLAAKEIIEEILSVPLI